jgi:hypothetical protein
MPQANGGDRFAPVPSEAAPALSGATSELWALARIVETSDLIRLPDGREFLLTPAPAELVDALAAFGADAEDLEDEGIALDWTIGRTVDLPDGRQTYEIIIHDGDREPEEYAGGRIR